MGVGPSTGMATLGRWRSVLRERHLPWLFTLFLVLALTLESRTGVVNILRGPLFLAVLLCMEGTDLRALWANGPARWFLLLMAWLGLSLLWDGATEEDWKILQRGLQVLTLLMLVFLVGRCRPDWQGRILRLYVIAGLACAVLILQAWSGSPARLTDLYPGLERSHFYTRGVLTISIFTGWMMAVLAIAALYMALATDSRLGLLYLACALLCALVMVLTQARAAWLAGVLGIAMVLWHHRPRRWWLWLATVPLVPVAVALWVPEWRDILADSLERGGSFRLSIWRNAVYRVLESPLHALVGHGLSASTRTVAEGILQNHYHSLYLNTLFHGGLVGLGLYLGCLWRLVLDWRREPRNWLWACLLIPMQLAFVVDGENSFVTPSAMMLAYLLPLFWAMHNWQPFVSDQTTNGLPGHKWG